MLRYLPVLLVSSKPCFACTGHQCWCDVSAITTNALTKLLFMQLPAT
jgi:hypothetical protein